MILLNLITYCETRFDRQGCLRLVTKDKATNNKFKTEYTPSNVTSSYYTSQKQPVVSLEITQTFKTMRHELS